MKTIKAYLINQREIAAVEFYNILQKGGNMIDAAFWLERMNHLGLMIQQLEDGQTLKHGTKTKPKG